VFYDWLAAEWSSDVALAWYNTMLTLISVVLSGIIIAVGNILARTMEPDQFSGAFIGLALVSAEMLSMLISGALTAATNMEIALISVERINEFVEGFRREDVRVLGPDEPDELAAWQTKALAEWPQDGRITFESVVVRYREDRPPALKGISIDLAPGEHVGIIGRTGSGKTTILLALLRIVAVESGSISIDGVDITSVTLHELRSRVGIVMQDPIIFTGSLAENLDPTAARTRDELIDVSQRIGLVGASLSHSDVSEALDAPAVLPSGDGLSASERQLLCLVRALLR